MRPYVEDLRSTKTRNGSRRGAKNALPLPNEAEVAAASPRFATLTRVNKRTSGIFPTTTRLRRRMTSSGRGGAMLSFKHILVPLDFSAPSKRALKLASELALKFGSSLTLVHVCEIPTYAGMAASLPDLISSLEQGAARALEQLVEPVRRRLP